MRKFFTLICALLIAHITTAQYCGTSGPSICTPSATMTQKGFSPSPNLLAPFLNGQATSATIQIKAPDTLFFASFGSIHVDSMRIDSIKNLPAGLCWATNKATNTFINQEQGCIVLSGTPCTLNGQYKMEVYVTIKTPSFLGIALRGILSDQVGYSYFLRLKNSTDATIPVDTTQTNTNPFIAYSSPPSCMPAGYYFSASLVSSDTVCDGGQVSLHLNTNVPLSNINHFKLRIENTYGFNGPFIHYSDSILADTSGAYAFNLPDSIYDNVASCDGYQLYDLYFMASDTTTEAYVGALKIVRPPRILNVYSMNMCQGSQVTLGHIQGCTDAYNWYVIPGMFPFSSMQMITMSPTVTTQYRLTVSHSICSVDSIFTITVVPNPTVTLLDTLVATCLNDSAHIGVVNPNPFLYSYIWTSMYGFSAYQPVIAVLPYGTGFDIYTLHVTDTNGCNASKTVQVNIKQSPDQQLCMVSVDSTSTHNVIIWEKADRPATDSFYLYREVSTNNYAKIASFFQSDLSEYHDYGANPNATGYRYKISVLDTCGNESYQSSYHNSIHLQYLGAGNLQWNNYDVEGQITPVASYDIYRDSTGTGTWQQILNVSGTQNTATDPNFSLYPNAKYRVVANWSYTCTSSRSVFNGVLSNSIRNQVNGVAGISDDVAININPNPAKSTIIVSFETAQTGSGEMYLTDLLGKTVLTELPFAASGFTQKTINVSSLSNGIYLLHVLMNGKHCTQKVAISH